MLQDNQSLIEKNWKLCIEYYDNNFLIISQAVNIITTARTCQVYLPEGL